MLKGIIQLSGRFTLQLTSPECTDCLHSFTFFSMALGGEIYPVTINRGDFHRQRGGMGKASITN